MALQGLASSQAPQYKGLDLNIIGDAAKMRQQNFIKANEAMSNTLQALQTQDFVDEEARAQATARAQARYGELVQRHQNNLGAALPDVMTAVRETAADPYNMYNKYQMENLNAQNELKAKFGNKAIVMNDVANQRISEHIDPTGTVVEPVMLKNKLSADVREASDYIKVAQSLGKDLNMRKFSSKLMREPGFETFLRTGDVSLLSKNMLLEYANTPSVRATFMANTTAGIDNRPEAGYQVDDRGITSNKFTRPQPVGSKFADGAAQEIYAALIGKEDRDENRGYIQDDVEMRDANLAKLKGDTVKEPVNVPLGHGEKSITMQNLYGKKLKDLKFDASGKVIPSTKQGGIDGGFLGVKIDPNDPLNKKTAPVVAKEDAKFLDEISSKYAFPKGFTQKQTNDVLLATEKQMQKVDVSPVLLAEDARGRFGSLLLASFYKQTVVGDKGEFTLGGEDGFKKFKSENNLPDDWTPQQAIKDGTMLIHSINSIGDARLNKAAPGSFGVTLLDKDGQPNEVEISSPNKEVRAIFEAPTTIMSNIGKGVTNDRLQFTGSYDIVQQNVYNSTNNSIEPILTLSAKNGATRVVNPNTGEVMEVSDPNQFETIMKAANQHMTSRGMNQGQREEYLNSILPDRVDMQGVRKFTEDAFKTSSSTVESILGKTSSATTNKTLETLNPGT